MKLELEPFYRFLYALDDFQVFALSMDLERLSLEDKPEGAGQPPERGGYHYPRRSYSNFSHPSKWQRTMVESLRCPFVELPEEVMGSLQAYGLKIGLGFRFRPGQGDFLLQELTLPRKEEKLKFMSSSLGISYYKAALKPMTIPALVAKN